ncbi:hypothetical protein [Streptomyces sp. TS71-3]|uniref:hypothetical protein n=1 Tax=Streptomyces sp. TS71-3 TaxID=2733862 RepID=UPI001B0ACC30|nr:hypothetical protein [Streptomyces sp. TS71-3]GHJ34423.1 hypothetical protein Sm713_00320 [Streptomyces sp. TS71-3]
MPFFTITLTALSVGFEQLIQWRYGPMGIIALLLSIGIRARNTMLVWVAVVIVLMLLAH